MLFSPFVVASPTEIVTAEVRPASPDALRDGVRAELGLASPVGFAGASAWHDVTPHFRLEGGGGFGWSGLQVSALARAMLGTPNHRLVPGLGVSLGIPTDNGEIADPSVDGHRDSSVVMPWLNVDVLGYEYKSDAGWTLLTAFGLFTPLRTGVWGGAEFGGQLHPFRSWYPEGHIAFGRAF